ncbi:TRAP transporter permease [Chloroflexota bacterium]
MTEGLMVDLAPEKGNDGRKSLDITIAALAIGMGLFHIVSSLSLLVGPLQYVNIHLTFALMIIYLTAIRTSRRRLWPLLIIFIVGSLVAFIYIFLFADDLHLRAGFPLTQDIIIGVIVLVVIMEAARRSFGVIIPIVALLFLAYIFFGHYLPGELRAPAYSPGKIISGTTMGLNRGVYGLFLEISAYYIFLFVLFAALLQQTGAVRFFIEVGRWVGKRFAGGPAMTSVVTSAMIGTVTGSISANVATTGSFTIPTMKKAGYSPVQAGAIEATASTGGQIMPPVMGAAAFIMAGITGVPYAQIIAMAAIPAMLYFLSAAAYVQLQAKKLKLTAEPEPVNVKELLLTAPLFFIPLIFLVWRLMIGYPLPSTMAITVLILIVLSLFRKETRPSWSKWVQGFKQGAKTGAEVAAVCAVLGIALVVVEMTALAIKLPRMIEAISQGNLGIALVITMFVSLFLGTGMTTTAAYVLVAVVIAPVLVHMGVQLMQAHMFCFYFAIISSVTPPVAIAAVVSSKLAGGSFIKTGIESTKVAVGGFIVPFLFIWCPVILLLPQEPLSAVTGLIAAVVSIVALQIAICNYYMTNISLMERIIYILVGATLVASVVLQDNILFGISMAAFIFMSGWQYRKSRVSRSQPTLAA